MCLLVPQSPIPTVFLPNCLDTVTHECIFHFVVNNVGINYEFTRVVVSTLVPQVQILSITLFATLFYPNATFYLLVLSLTTLYFVHVRLVKVVYPLASTVPILFFRRYDCI